MLSNRNEFFSKKKSNSLFHLFYFLSPPSPDPPSNMQKRRERHTTRDQPASLHPCCPRAFIVPIERDEARANGDRDDNRRFRAHRVVRFAFVPRECPFNSPRLSTNRPGRFLWISLCLSPHTIRSERYCAATRKTVASLIEEIVKCFVYGHRWTHRKV